MVRFGWVHRADLGGRRQALADDRACHRGPGRLRLGAAPRKRHPLAAQQAVLAGQRVDVGGGGRRVARGGQRLPFFQRLLYPLLRSGMMGPGLR